MNPIAAEQSQKSSLAPLNSNMNKTLARPSIRPDLFAFPSCAPLTPSTWHTSILATLPNLKDAFMIRSQINDLLLTKLQQELYQAQKKLDFLDVYLIQQFQDFCGPKHPPMNPPIDIIRTNWTCVTLNWTKLRRAFAKIAVFSEIERTQPLGYSRASKAVLCLKHLLQDKITNRYLKPRDVVTPEFLTILCAETMIAQRVYIAPSRITLTPYSGITLFIGDKDMQQLKEAPQQLEKEFAITFINTN